MVCKQAKVTKAVSAKVVLCSFAFVVAFSLGFHVAAARAEGNGPAAQIPTSIHSSTGNHVIYLPMVMQVATEGSQESIPNDAYLQQEWGLEAVKASQAWNLTRGSASVIVAVLDTGVDWNHPDLANKLVSGWNVIDDNDNTQDDHGHGTHVAGIIGAATNNVIGVAGLGWDTKVMPVKIATREGYTWSSAIASGIRYAADHGANVINMSVAGAAPCPGDVQAAVDYAHEKGVVLVASAGNDGANVDNLPANCTHVLGVAATTSAGSLAGYSSYGNYVSVAAPGSLIYSTMMGGGYGYMSGTSMSAPYVAGLAALVRSQHSVYTPDQVASAILDNADEEGAASWDQHAGCGRINAFQTLSVGARGDTPTCRIGAVTPVSPTSQSLATAAFVPGRIIVSFRSGVAAPQTAQRYGTGKFVPALSAWKIQVPQGQEQAILAALRSDPSVSYADLDYELMIR
jgi:subtilisin family serine protease